MLTSRGSLHLTNSYGKKSEGSTSKPGAEGGWKFRKLLEYPGQSRSGRPTNLRRESGEIRKKPQGGTKKDLTERESSDPQTAYSLKVWGQNHLDNATQRWKKGGQKKLLRRGDRGKKGSGETVHAVQKVVAAKIILLGLPRLWKERKQPDSIKTFGKA